jgi:hypothetical protein
MKNEQMFETFMLGFGELYDKPITPVIIKLYWLALEPFSDDQCLKAFEAAPARYKFFPKPAELISDMTAPLELLAQQQTGYFIAMLQGTGYQNPKGWRKEPITKRLLAGRFKGTFERSREDDIKWLEKEFYKAFLDIGDYIEGDTKSQIEASADIKKLVKGIG